MSRLKRIETTTRVLLFIFGFEHRHGNQPYHFREHRIFRPFGIPQTGIQDDAMGQGGFNKLLDIIWHYEATTQNW